MSAMSISKRILFENDPRDDHIRRELSEKAARELAPFVHKIGLRRRNRFGKKPHWDPSWRLSLTSAAAELDKQHVIINWQVCFLTQADADETRTRAEELYNQRLAALLKPARA